MTRKFLLILGYLILAAALTTLCACSSLRHNIPEGHSLFRGYSTLCNGKLQLAALEGQKPASDLTLPAGEQQLLVYYQSEPKLPDKHFSPQNYLCVYNSIHKLSFHSKPGTIYRFSVEEHEPKQFKIFAREQTDRRLPQTEAIETLSEQLKLNRKCGFYTQRT